MWEDNVFKHWKLRTVKMIISRKLISRFVVILLNYLQSVLVVNIDQLTLKLIWNYTNSRIAKHNLGKKQERLCIADN